MRLNAHTSNPKITIGSHTFENGPGIQLGYNTSGVLGFYAGDGSNDYIKYILGTGVDIKTAVFKLDTDNLDIDSATTVDIDAVGALSLQGGAASDLTTGAGAITVDGKTGITLKEGERTILTNTTTSGKLKVDSDYETYEIHTGIKRNNLSLIPDLGLSVSYSKTPSYNESKYFSWNDRHIGNVSVFFSDDYNLIKKIIGANPQLIKKRLEKCIISEFLISLFQYFRIKFSTTLTPESRYTAPIKASHASANILSSIFKFFL